MKLKIGTFFYLILFLLEDRVTYAAQAVEETTKSNISIITNIFSGQLLLNIAFAFFIIIVTFILSKLIPNRISSHFEKYMGVGTNGEEILGVITRTTSVLVLVIGFSATLTVLGVDMSIFMGGVGFGVGFTLKVFLSNFISGIIMVTQGTYHNGDLIEIEGKMGRIKKIYSLYTAVEQFDGVVYFVPNLKFLEENVSNFYSNDKRRIDVEVVVSYDTDIYKAKQIMMKVIEQFPNILKSPEPNVLVDKLGENGVLLTLRCWINSDGTYISTKSNITETVNLGFKKSGIDIPYKNITITNNTKPV